MGVLFLSNSKGRDAEVMAESVRSMLRVRWLDAEGRQVASQRILRGTIDRDFDALLARFGTMSNVGQALIHDDPEIDFEAVGSFLYDTSRAYIGPDKKIVHRVTQWEVVRNPDGTERTRRPRQIAVPNVTADQPLRWSGKLLPKREVFNKVVIAAKLQAVHVNGLTYDFLYEMAKELEKKDSLLVVGAGPKANQPIVLRRGATPYRGFLEGRTRGEEYCLLLHLSNMELKAPAATPPSAEGGSKGQGEES
jgi:hypothetical protein